VEFTRTSAPPLSGAAATGKVNPPMSNIRISKPWINDREKRIENLLMSGITQTPDLNGLINFMWFFFGRVV
jgi:hypothetical protein